MLKHHADFFPGGVNVGLAVKNVHIVHNDLAAVDLLQVIQAPQEGGLSAARRADDDHHLALVDVRGDAPQHLQFVEALFQILNMDLNVTLVHGLH